MADNPGSPFDPSNNSIRYNEVVRAQMVSQYTNQIPAPPQRNVWDEYRIAREPRYQYGVPGGQDQRRYRRQNELNSSAFAGAAMTTAADFGVWGAAGGVATAMGATGLMAMAAPMAVTAALTAPLAAGVKYNLDRRKFMASMASDVEMYRDKAGFNSLSYNQATELGNSIGGNMSRGGGFFNREEQGRIQKIGLSNDMLNARSTGGGINSMMKSGTMGQYKQNLGELTKTAEEAVKIMNTTIEGAMSVIKEMKSSGLSTAQARQQIRTAGAYGKASGIGTQNMLQVGAAGAQMVQGTNWSAGVGSSMAIHGATSAALMSQASGGMGYAVQRAGGAAQAGTQLAAMQMNVLNSGIGTKLVAAAMNPDGSLNEKKFQDVMTRGYSGHKISSMANSTGYRMGAGGRVMFPFDKQKAIEGMTNVERDLMSLQGFNAWKSGRGGNRKQQAHAYAQMFSGGDMKSAELFAQSLITNPQYGQMNAANRVQSALLSQGDMYAYQTPWQRGTAALQKKFDPAVQWTRKAGGQLLDAGTGAMDTFGEMGRSIAGVAGRTLSRAFDERGFNMGPLSSKYGNYIANYGDQTYEEALAITAGAGVKGSAQEAIDARNRINKYGVGDREPPSGGNNIKGINIRDIIANRKKFSTVSTHLTQVMAAGTGKAATGFLQDATVRAALDLKSGEMPTLIGDDGSSTQDPIKIVNALTGNLNQNVEKARSLRTHEATFQKYLGDLRSVNPKLADDAERKASGLIAAGRESGKSVNWDDSVHYNTSSVMKDVVDSSIAYGNKSLRKIDSLSFDGASVLKSARLARAEMLGGRVDRATKSIKVNKGWGPWRTSTIEEGSDYTVKVKGTHAAQFKATGMSSDTFIANMRQAKKVGLVSVQNMLTGQEGVTDENITAFTEAYNSGDYKDLLSLEEQASGVRGMRQLQGRANATSNMLKNAFGINVGVGGRATLMSMMAGAKSGATLGEFGKMSTADGKSLVGNLKSKGLVRSGKGLAALSNLQRGTFNQDDAAALQKDLAISKQVSEVVTHDADVQAVTDKYNNFKDLRDKINNNETLNDTDVSALAEMGMEGATAGAVVSKRDKKIFKGKAPETLAELASETTILQGAKRESASSKSTSATVSPPIMNYWSNRWTL